VQPIPPYQSEDGLIEPSCFLAIPRTTDQRVERVVRDAVQKAGFEPISRNEARIGFRTPDERLTQADCVIADLTGQNTSVYYYVGLARAMGKGIFLLSQANAVIPTDLRGYVVLHYDLTPEGFDDLAYRVVDSLEHFRRFPRRTNLPANASLPFNIDWDRLERSETDNLCRELLVQMGFRKVDWEKGFREFDLIAELPRRDPDGYMYSELWLVSMGRNAPIEMMMEFVMEPGYLAHRMMREERFSRLLAADRNESSVTFLLIALDPGISKEKIAHVAGADRRFRSREALSVRIRIWDRDQLTSLVQQFPQLA
jgi:hypothetical protein